MMKGDRSSSIKACESFFFGYIAYLFDFQRKSHYLSKIITCKINIIVEKIDCSFHDLYNYTPQRQSQRAIDDNKNSERKLISTKSIFENQILRKKKIVPLALLLPGDKRWTRVYEESKNNSPSFPEEIKAILDVEYHIIIKMISDFLKKSTGDKPEVQYLDIEKRTLPNTVNLAPLASVPWIIKFGDLIPSNGLIEKGEVIASIQKQIDKSLSNSNFEVPLDFLLFSELLSTLSAHGGLTGKDFNPEDAVCLLKLTGAQELKEFYHASPSVYSDLASTTISDKILSLNNDAKVKEMPFICISSEVPYPRFRMNYPDRDLSGDSRRTSLVDRLFSGTENNDQSDFFFIEQTDFLIILVYELLALCKANMPRLSNGGSRSLKLESIEFQYSLQEDVKINLNINIPTYIKQEETWYGDEDGAALY